MTGVPLQMCSVVALTNIVAIPMCFFPVHSYTALECTFLLYYLALTSMFAVAYFELRVSKHQLCVTFLAYALPAITFNRIVQHFQPKILNSQVL